MGLDGCGLSLVDVVSKVGGLSVVEEVRGRTRAGGQIQQNRHFMEHLF
jgi:hypothetical protein